MQAIYFQELEYPRQTGCITFKREKQNEGNSTQQLAGKKLGTRTPGKRLTQWECLTFAMDGKSLDFRIKRQTP
jgi:hypothetical protein